MTSIAYSPVTIQTSPRSEPSTPPWFGEVALIARRRFGHYEVIDFVAVLLGYAISGERTLETFYDRLQPFALPFMALFGRERLPHRSTLSRFLASLDQVTVEALRTLFLDHLLARPPGGEEKLDSKENQGGCGIGKKGTGWCSMWMGCGKRRALEPYHRQQTDRPAAIARRLRSWLSGT